MKAKIVATIFEGETKFNVFIKNKNDIFWIKQEGYHGHFKNHKLAMLFINSKYPECKDIRYIKKGYLKATEAKITQKNTTHGKKVYVSVKHFGFWRSIYFVNWGGGISADFETTTNARQHINEIFPDVSNIVI